MTGRAVFAVAAAATLVLAWPAARAVQELGRLRTERATATALLRAPPAPPIAPRAVRADDADAARAAVARRIAAAAARGDVLVEGMSADAGAPAGLVLLDLRLSGAEKAVLGMVDALERDAVPMRFVQWRLRPVPGGVRLEGRAVVPWR